MNAPVRRKKDLRKLAGRFALDFATVAQGPARAATTARRTRGAALAGAPMGAPTPNAAMLRLQALAARDAAESQGTLPDPSRATPARSDSGEGIDRTDRSAPARSDSGEGIWRTDRSAPARVDSDEGIERTDRSAPSRPGDGEGMESTDRSAVVAPLSPVQANWTPLGPLAVPGGQTYGGARVLISGRITAIAPHSVDGDTLYIGSSRGGVWRSSDAGATWVPLTDDAPSLAIGALALCEGHPQALYAGTGEGNVQFYSSAFPESSAPGVYLGVGVLRSGDGGATWQHHAAALLAGHSFYRIAVQRSNAQHAFAATSAGLARTRDGTTWEILHGHGLPPLAGRVLACCDVLIDRGDASGNTVYAAFFGSGIFKSSNALAAQPTFVPLGGGLPAAAAVGRISLHQSASQPARKVALVGGSNDGFKGLYRTTNAAGTAWELCTDSATIELYGAFTSGVMVDPTSEDLVYVSGVELYRCRRSAATGDWEVTNIGGAIHPDSHCLAFHPTRNRTLYSGNDGGIYVSHDAGATWDDSPNEGLCLLQYEAIDHHGASDALVQGGTQDNGTQQYRNSPVHYHSADGDGGYCAVHKTDGHHVMHSYYGNSPQRSAQAGQMGSYIEVKAGLNGSGLFYPPLAIAPGSGRVAWGTEVVNIDDDMGSGGWPGAGLALPGATGPVSALTFTHADLLHCATTQGEVYRLERQAGTWAVRALHGAPLPQGQWVWDIHTLPGDEDSVLLCFSGFGLEQHVWRGRVPASGSANWEPLSQGLPDVPMYALACLSASDWAVGTDIGVFRSTDAGAHWANASHGLPNTAVYDLRQRPGSTLLRAATHGRGLWELRTDVATPPAAEIFVRRHLMHDGRSASASAAPAQAAWADATRQVALGDALWWWHCADIKCDAPPQWQLHESQRNYLHFETRLVHEGAERGNAQRIYVQVHNRGPLAAEQVTARLLWTPACAGLPDLPADFWNAWPSGAGNAHWKPIGAPQVIASLPALRPQVLQWDWTPAPGEAAQGCLLVVMDSASDPLPPASKRIVDVAQLVCSERRVGLKNLHVVKHVPSALRALPLALHAPAARNGGYWLRVPKSATAAVKLSLLLPRRLSTKVMSAALPPGMKVTPLSARDLARLERQWRVTEMRSPASWQALLRSHDMTRQFSVAAGSPGFDLALGLRRGAHESVLLLWRTGSGSPPSAATWTALQWAGAGDVVGGCTLVTA